MNSDNTDTRVQPVTRDHEVRSTQAYGYDNPGANRVVRHDGDDHRHDHRETAPFYKTSEFLVTVLAAAAVLIAGFVGGDDSLNNFHMWTLFTVIVSAYTVSRGIAKAGSADRN